MHRGPRKIYCFENIVLTESFNITMATNYKHILCNIAMCTLCKILIKYTKRQRAWLKERENVHTGIQNIMTLLIISSYKTRRLQFYISARTHLYIRVMWV